MFEREEVEIVTEAMQALGLKPVLGPHLLDRYGYLAGRDRDRAADVNQFFADDRIAAVMPMRGGWGSARILPYLDYDSIRRNPKVIIGFSDITALLLGIYAKTGLITFHGPHGVTSWLPRQTDYFRRVLFEGEVLTYTNPSDDSPRLMQVQHRIQTLTSGTARGKLIGGNLSVLSAIAGSPYLPSFEGAILFLEDINENVYRIDRMLTHLKVAGLLDRLSGFIFGQCVRCLPGADYGSLTLEQVLSDHIQPLGIPAWSGADIGHVENIITLPIGMDVEIDADRGAISLLASPML